MSHLPIQPVDYYLDRIKKQHVIFAGVVIVLLIFAGQATSLVSAIKPPKGTRMPGQISPHYPNRPRYATLTTNPNDIDPKLYWSAYRFIPSQDTIMNSNYGGIVV